jgi:hypothetical protein
LAPSTRRLYEATFANFLQFLQEVGRDMNTSQVGRNELPAASFQAEAAVSARNGK